jgi:hypothetical protein
MRLLFLFPAWLIFSCSSPERHLLIDQPAPVVAGAEEPYLFTDSAGTVWLSYQQRHDTISSLWLTAYQNGEWRSPQQIIQGYNWFVNWADYPVMASDAKGNLVTHILHRSGEGKFAYDVHILTSNDSGKTWSEPHKLHDDNTQTEHGFVSAIPYGDNFFMCWLDGRNTTGSESHHHGHHGSMTLRAAIIDKHGNKVKEWELDNRVCDCCQTTAAITDKGPVVIYRNRSDEEVRDIFITRYEDGNWTAPKPVHGDNWIIHGCPVNGPRCDAMGNTLVVAWFTAAGDEPRVQVIFSSDGGKTFGKPVRVDEGNTIGRVDVVLLNNNEALVSWMEGEAIKVAFIDATGRKGKSLTVAHSSEKRASGFPQLTRFNKGALMAWTSPADSAVRTAVLTWQ